ncbi:hypothetical protein HY78_02155 [Rhizorhabdus wittichii DC-6]|nr:hypothetical protein HY78_02155 [Rhizorhabdus wittichii DC-6]
MSLVIRRISIKQFRKFREPLIIEGLSDGLNVIIEPNETGKSTLLEALRAAFFVRYNTRNQLAQSFAPHGEAVAPEIEVGFDIADASWSVRKHFLRSPSVEVTGPQGKAEGEDAEALLSALLGSIRDTSRGGDISTYGALGLLWVAQTEALSVSAPSQLVRDSVASTLEAEVGSIMGGAAYRRVRERIEAQFENYWTPTGQKRGRQAEARERVEAAETEAADAASRLAALEQSFANLDAARARLKIIERELGDETDAQARKDLVAALDVARAAAQILATRRAEHEAAQGALKALEDLQRRHEEATEARNRTALALAAARERRATLSDSLAAAKLKAAEARSALEAARSQRQDARTALAAGEEAARQARRRAAVAAARQRHAELGDLEQAQRDAKALAATLIAAEQIAALEANDRAVAEAQAIATAGATHITLSGIPAGVTIDGEPMPLGERKLTRAVRIGFGDAELLVSPPLAAASAEELLATAERRRQALLDELGVDDITAARARNDAARDAAGELRTLAARIAALTPVDDLLELASGPDALKLFVNGLGDDPGEPASDLPDLSALHRDMDAADTMLHRAEGAQDSAIEALRLIEEEDAPLSTAEAGALSDLANAAALVEAIEARTEWSSLVDDLVLARERAAGASVKLEEATRDASAHDVGAITRRIETIDARIRTTVEARAKLETDIARLEGTIETEGGLGLADRAAAAEEEAQEARAAFQRVSEEADTLKLLRDLLEQARTETSAKFVGPVAKRAKRHIERLLPGCELSFSEDMALDSVMRAGVDENCANLSRGTQEQLAVLTRIAFADMLLEQGRPVSLILDDPLVYSDDARLDLMIDILTEAAERMQVILLTCRDRAFRHLGGNRIALVR